MKTNHIFASLLVLGFSLGAAAQNTVSGNGVKAIAALSNCGQAILEAKANGGWIGETYILGDASMDFKVFSQGVNFEPVANGTIELRPKLDSNLPMDGVVEVTCVYHKK